MIRESDNHVFAKDSSDRAFDRTARLLVDDDEDVFHALVDCVGHRPSSERFCDRVQSRDASLIIGCDHRVTDARHRDPEPLCGAHGALSLGSKA